MLKSLLARAARASLACALSWALCLAPVAADQSPLFSPTTGTVSGLNLTNNYNSALNALATCNSGASAPSNPISAAPVAGQCWYNTSTGAVSTYDGTDWLTIGYIDTTNHAWTPVLGGGAATNVASATTTNLCGAAGGSPVQPYLTITGSVTISAFGSNCASGQIKILSFSGALTLTYNATSLIIPGAASITTAAGDVAMVVYLGSGNWSVFSYTHASGLGVSSFGPSGSPRTGNVVASTGDYTTAQLTTSTSASSPAAGKIGQIIPCQVTQASPVSLTSGTPANICSVSVTAGNWACSGNIGIAVGATGTGIGWITLTSGTQPAAPNSGAYAEFGTGAVTSAVLDAALSSFFVQVSTTTPVYLGGLQANGSTQNGWGALNCLRVN